MKYRLSISGFFIVSVLLWTANAGAQTGIGTITPHASAELDITSTTRGFLPPRMSAIERLAIPSPAQGLMVYDNDSASVMLYDNSGWKAMANTTQAGSGGSGGGFWQPNGSGGDIFYSDGKVSIGTNGLPAGRMIVYDATPNLTSGVFQASCGNNSIAVEGNDLSTFGNFNGIGIYGAAYVGTGVRGFSTFNTGGSFESTYGTALYVGSGNVGIGVQNPTAKLELAGQIKITAGNPGAGKVLTSDADGLASWQTPATGGGGSNGWTSISSAVYQTDLNDGTVAIGGNNPSSSTKLSVFGTSLKRNAMYISAYGDTNVVLSTVFGKVGFGTSNPSERLEVCGNIKALGSINASGNISANQSITCSSDRRYKKDITTLSGALDKLTRLRGVSYNWRQTEFPDRQFNNRLQIGVIAQEVETVYPELVYTDKDGYRSVDYAKLTPVLIEAVKELKRQNEELQKANHSLEERSASIESRLKMLEENMSVPAASRTSLATNQK